jgi:predicted Zn-dependent protease with MMP-like domain
MLNNMSLYVIDVENRSSNDILEGVEILAFLTPEQAWGQSDGSDIVHAYEDRHGEMIPRQFLLRDVKACRLL